METRKLIKLGNSSLAVSLPKEWLRKSGLNRGDLIFLEDLKGDLIVSNKKREEMMEEKEITVNVKGKSEDALLAELSSVYINNFNYLTIEAIDSREKLKKIKEILNNFVGLEIVEQNHDKIIAKDTLGIKMISVNEIIRRMDNTVRSMFEDLMEVVNKEKINKRLLLEVADADKDVNKLYFLIWKLVRKGMVDEKKAQILGTDLLGLSSLQWIAMNLELIGDEIKRIARFLNEEKPDKAEKRKREEFKELLSTILKNYTDAMTAYYKNNKDLALEIASRNDKLTIEKCNKFFKDYKSPDVARITERLKTIQGAIHYITRSVSY